MEALSGPYESRQYGMLYWTQERKDNTDLWTRATQFCEGKDEQQYPNCEIIRHVDVLGRGELPEVDSTSLMMEPMAPDTFVPSRQNR